MTFCKSLKGKQLKDISEPKMSELDKTMLLLCQFYNFFVSNSFYDPEHTFYCNVMDYFGSYEELEGFLNRTKQTLDQHFCPFGRNSIKTLELTEEDEELLTNDK